MNRLSPISSACATRGSSSRTGSDGSGNRSIHFDSHHERRIAVLTPPFLDMEIPRRARAAAAGYSSSSSSSTSKNRSNITKDIRRADEKDSAPLALKDLLKSPSNSNENSSSSNSRTRKAATPDVASGRTERKAKQDRNEFYYPTPSDFPPDIESADLNWTGIATEGRVADELKSKDIRCVEEENASYEESITRRPNEVVVMKHDDFDAVSTISGSRAVEAENLHALLDEVLNVQDTPTSAPISEIVPETQWPPVPPPRTQQRQQPPPRSYAAPPRAPAAADTSTAVEIEVSQGQYEVVRGAKETLRAVNSGVAEVVSCPTCENALATVADCKYVLCPNCRIMFPMPHDNEILSRYGVGLGLGL